MRGFLDCSTSRWPNTTSRSAKPSSKSLDLARKEDQASSVLAGREGRSSPDTEGLRIAIAGRLPLYTEVPRNQLCGSPPSSPQSDISRLTSLHPICARFVVCVPDKRPECNGPTLTCVQRYKSAENQLQAQLQPRERRWWRW